MRIDIRRRRPVIANKMGGFSGRAIFPIALRMVYQVAHAVSVPVIGIGGVSMCALAEVLQGQGLIVKKHSRVDMKLMEDIEYDAEGNEVSKSYEPA